MTWHARNKKSLPKHAPQRMSENYSPVQSIGLQADGPLRGRGECRDWGSGSSGSIDRGRRCRLVRCRAACFVTFRDAVAVQAVVRWGRHKVTAQCRRNFDIVSGLPASSLPTCVPGGTCRTGAWCCSAASTGLTAPTATATAEGTTSPWARGAHLIPRRSWSRSCSDQGVHGLPGCHQRVRCPRRSGLPPGDIPGGNIGMPNRT